MLAHLKYYPTYKHSGVEWLGEVPEHWEIRRLGSTVQDCINGTWGNDTNGHDDVVCVRVADFDRTQLRVRLENRTMRAVSNDERIQRLLKHGDLLLEKSGGGDLHPVGAVVLYDHDDSAVCSNFIARMPVAPSHDSKFLVYLHFALYTRRINVRSIKQTTGIQNLDAYDYLSERVAIPVIDEQLVISRFLDQTTQQIDRFILANEKLIKLLNELKHATIHEAIVGRKNISTSKPYPAYKDTGVEWLAEVPKDWKLVRLKVCSDSVSEPSTDENESEKSVLALEHVESWTGRILSTASSSEFDSKLKHFQKGDILFGKLRPYLAKVVLPQTEGLCVSEFLVIRTKSVQCSAHFLEYLLRSKLFIGFVDSSTFGAKMPRAEWQFIGGITIALPPLSEQIMITSFLDKITANIDSLIQKALGQIKLAQEYRNCLIKDVVTGKIDVRDAVHTCSI